MLQVIRPPRLTPNPTQLESTKWLTPYEGSCNRTVQIEVSDRKFLTNPFQIGRTAAVTTTRQGVISTIRDRQRFGHVFCFEHNQHRPKNFLLSDLRIGKHIHKNVGTDIIPLGSQFGIQPS